MRQYRSIAASEIQICKILLGLPVSALSVNVEEQNHKNFARHADEEYQIEVACCGAECGERKHKETGQEQSGGLLLDPDDDAGDDERDDHAVSENRGTDGVCPAGSGILDAGIAGESNVFCTGGGDNAGSNAGDYERSGNDPYDRLAGLFEVECICTDGQQQGMSAPWLM